MAWNGLGAYLLNPAYTPEVNGNTIDAPRYNGALTDIAAGITAALAKNGENVPTANLPMGGYKHTGVAQGTANGQYVEYSQLASARVVPVTVISAAYTVTPSNAWTQLRHPNTDVTARTWTFQANSVSAYTDGTMITLVNKHGAGIITITPTDTMRLAGTGATGSRSLSADGVATAIWDATAVEWIISGTGLT